MGEEVRGAEVAATEAAEVAAVVDSADVAAAEAEAAGAAAVDSAAAEAVGAATTTAAATKTDAAAEAANGNSNDEERRAAERAAQELAENNALAAVFDDVRECSGESQLSTPDRWVELGLVPTHMSAEDFEMFVYDYLENYMKEHKQEVAQQKAAAQQKVGSFHSAKTAVGIPAFMRNKESEVKPAENVAAAKTITKADTAADENTNAPTTTKTRANTQISPTADAESNTAANTDADAEGSAAASEPLFVSARPERTQHAKSTVTVSDPNNPFFGLEIPAGHKLELIEGEWTLVKDEAAEPVKRELDPRGIVTLVGQYSYYLYDEEQMTSTYAQWAFLAAEDDPLMTFVNCVREEGRTYPRPLAAGDLANPPFRMSASKVAQTWQQIQESGKYPDIIQVKASNGDIYYASTLYLTPAYAESLAEWSSVGRSMNV